MPADPVLGILGGLHGRRWKDLRQYVPLNVRLEVQSGLLTTSQMLVWEAKVLSDQVFVEADLRVVSTTNVVDGAFDAVSSFEAEVTGELFFRMALPELRVLLFSLLFVSEGRPQLKVSSLRHGFLGTFGRRGGKAPALVGAELRILATILEVFVAFQCNQRVVLDPVWLFSEGLLSWKIGVVVHLKVCLIHETGINGLVLSIRLLWLNSDGQHTAGNLLLLRIDLLITLDAIIFRLLLRTGVLV